MKVPPKFGMTRLKFAAYVAILVVTISLLLNLESLKVVPSILLVAALLISKAAAAPFFFGFILQGIFSRNNVPDIVSLFIALISMVFLWYLSGFQFLEQSNLFIELFLLLGSIMVVKGFIDSGARFFRKIRDKKSYNKSLKRDATKDGRAP